MDEDVNKLTPVEESTLLAYKTFFSTEEGRLVLDDLYNLCFAMLGSYMADQKLHSYEEGKRSVLLRILRLGGINVRDYIEYRNGLKR